MTKTSGDAGQRSGTMPAVTASSEPGQAIESTGVNARDRNELLQVRLRKLASQVYEKTGLVAAVLVPFLLVATVLHWRFAPEREYTWMQPLNILWHIVIGAYFPVSAAVVLLLGEASRFRTADLRSRLAELTRQVDSTATKRSLVRTSMVGIPALVLAALNDKYSHLDHIAIAGLALVVGIRWPDRTTLVRSALQLAYVLAIFTTVSYSFTVVKALLFYFRVPHDAGVLAVEHAIFRVYPHRVLASWAAAHPWSVVLSDFVYYRLFNHMTLVSVFLIGARCAQQRTEFISALVICYALGGCAYYLYPALGPGYFDPHAFDYLRRLPLLTNHYRGLLLANTKAMATGAPGPLQSYEYIACMPSLHMAHEFVMLYYARRSMPLLILSIGFTSLTIFAIVALGWHYPIDAVAGAALAATAITLVKWQSARLFPAAIRSR